VGSADDLLAGGGDADAEQAVVRNMAATSDGRLYIACSGVDKVGVVIPGK